MVLESPLIILYMILIAPVKYLALTLAHHYVMRVLQYNIKHVVMNGTVREIQDRGQELVDYAARLPSFNPNAAPLTALGEHMVENAEKIVIKRVIE